MGWLFEELEAREAAARTRVEALEAELAEVSRRLSVAREGLERLRIARETVAEVLAERPAVTADASETRVEGVSVSPYAGAERQVIGVLTVPNWQSGMGVACSPPLAAGQVPLPTPADSRDLPSLHSKVHSYRVQDKGRALEMTPHDTHDTTDPLPAP
ncbi:hypothetical protein ACFV4G_30045 [Kitasatospora sp. NPDC059747]|uniref:hypothetical protein n=1 Tax=Kitasatospora sp. NPDC059747 TaxID=3346930 RepID=UPI003653B6DA